MKTFIGRLISILVVAGGWLLYGVRSVLDLVGYATIPDDTKVALGRLDDIFRWVLSLPWWAPLGFALIATALLMFVSWPRPSAPSTPAVSPPANPRQARSKPPDIAWSFDNPAFPHMGFLGMHAEGDNIRFIGFQADGFNLTGKPLNKIASHIRSNVTNETFPVYFVIRGIRYAPDDTYGVPIGAQFMLSSEPLVKDGKALTEDQFKAKFSSFRFVFAYDRKTYTRDFNLEEIERNVGWFRSFAWPDKFPTPTLPPFH